MRRTGQNTSKIHLTNLKEVMYHYLKAKGADTFDKLAELFLFEQFTQSLNDTCLLYTSPSPRDRQKSRMPSSA